MASAFFTSEQVEIILGNPITKIVDFHRDDLPKDIFNRDIDEDVKDNFGAFLYSLAITKPAKLIQLADSYDNLGKRLLTFERAWRDKAEFPTILYLRCSSLVEKVAFSNASSLDIWTAVASLVVTFDSLSVPTTPKPLTKYNSTNTEADSVFLRQLRENWTSDYLPESLEALQEMIQINESKSDPEVHYAKTLTFVQSSGMGKSRLADVFGKECPMVNFVLREEKSLGYPPPDKEVLSFMRKKLSAQNQEKILNTPREKKLSSKRNSGEITNSPPSLESEKGHESSQIPDETFLESMATTVWNHSIAVGLLQASFEIFNEWIKQRKFKSLEELAATRHEEMAPYEHNSGNTADWDLRSACRTDFCVSVVSRAEEIADKLIRNQDWRHKFHDDRDSRVRLKLETGNSLVDLEKEAEKLKKTLEGFPRRASGPLLVMVFDEASSLLKLDGSDKLDPGRYHALNRIISRLKKYPMWFFFLSTESQVGMLLPAKDAERTGNFSDPSARIALRGHSLERFPPFLGLQLDVEDRKRMLNPNSLMKELDKKMNEFAHPKHMAMFGRPLWFGYDPAEMNWLAKLKLVGGKQETQFNPKDVDHVFAALSFRLSLDVCLQNPRTYPLARTAVNSFMRVVISMDQETGAMDTITPSEPVVAKAAMEHLCKKTGNWSHSIRTLTEELLDKGLIDKGLKGELYSRVILILARDRLQITLSRPDPELRIQVPQFPATFTVQQFLTALYHEDHHESILRIPREILEARMNFNHFVPIGENLTTDATPALLHDLLRRSAALQLAHNQPTYDKLIPIYFGDPDKPFKVSYCGAILVQDKNKVDVTTPWSMFGETFTEVHRPILKKDNPKGPRTGSYFTSDKMKYPVLLLLFDLGIIRTPNSRSADVQVSRTGGIKPDIWAIHSRGHDSIIFGCIKNMDCVDDCQRFFTSLKPEENKHNKLCQRNKIFSKETRDFRYSTFSKVLELATKRKQDGGEDVESRDKDGDTPMENV